MTNDELFERLAAIEHQRWADWQKWMHEQCHLTSAGSLVIPADCVVRWERQIATPYDALSDREKESDREQVRRYWDLIIEHFSRPSSNPGSGIAPGSQYLEQK